MERFNISLCTTHIIYTIFVQEYTESDMVSDVFVMRRMSSAAGRETKFVQRANSPAFAYTNNIDVVIVLYINIGRY